MQNVGATLIFGNISALGDPVSERAHKWVFPELNAIDGLELCNGLLVASSGRLAGEGGTEPAVCRRFILLTIEGRASDAGIGLF
jgi:hypothetical protein